MRTELTSPITVEGNKREGSGSRQSFASLSGASGAPSASLVYECLYVCLPTQLLTPRDKGLCLLNLSIPSAWHSLHPGNVFSNWIINELSSS